MIEIVALSAVLALIGASGARAQRRAAAARTLERFARWRSHVYVPARTKHDSPRVTGAQDGVPFTVDVVRANGSLRTRVVAHAPKGPCALLTVTQRGSLERAFGSRAASDANAVGIPSFDDAYRLRGVMGEEVRAWVELALPHLACLAERHDVWLGSDGTVVTLLWAGVEKNPIVLDAGRELVVSVAQEHRPQTPYR